MYALCLVVVVQEQADGRGGRHGYEFLLLGDFLPVIDQNRLECVRNEQPYSWSPHELLFL